MHKYAQYLDAEGIIPSFAIQFLCKMKKLTFLLIAGLFLACNTPGPTTNEAKAAFPADSVSADGRTSFHGNRIEEDYTAIPTSELVAYIRENGPSEVTIEGPINACCQAKGCWMTMPLNDHAEMRVKFKDYGFFVPKDASGKTAIARGIVSVDTVSVEERRHYAIDGGMPQKEAEMNIVEAEISLSFMADGVIIKERRE